MFLSCIGIVLFCLAKVFVKADAPPRDQRPDRPTTVPPPQPNQPYPPAPDRLTTPIKSTGRPDPYDSFSHTGSSTRICQGGNCPSSPNLLGPIVGSLGGILVLVLIGVLIFWFYLRRKTRPKIKQVPVTPAVKFIEHPPLYTDAISTFDGASRFYGTAPSRNDSISSHLYEKIHYNDKS